MNRLPLAVFALHACAALAQPLPDVHSLDWLAGAWIRHDANEVVRETWVGPANGTMVAVNLTSNARGGASFEFLRIARSDSGVSYFASPAGRPATEFALKEAGPRRVTFENPAIAFPRRIIYYRDGDALVARIEGEVKGEARSKEWRFARAVTPD